MNKTRRWKRKRIRSIRSQRISGLTLAISKAMYGREMCVVCGQAQKSQWDSVFAKYHTDGKRTSRTAHKSCWDAKHKEPETWALPTPF